MASHSVTRNGSSLSVLAYYVELKTRLLYTFRNRKLGCVLNSMYYFHFSKVSKTFYLCKNSRVVNFTGSQAYLLV